MRIAALKVGPEGLRVTELETKTREIGRRIASRRLSLNLTQEDLAKSIGKTTSAIKQIEAGESTKQFAFLVVLSRALATTPNELLGFEALPNSDSDLSAFASTVEGLLMESGWTEEKAELMTGLALKAVRQRAIAGVDRRLAARTLAVTWLRHDPQSE